MYCLDKKAVETLKKGMTKKEWKRYCWNFRGELMPRPAFFDDKRSKKRKKWAMKEIR